MAADKRADANAKALRESSQQFEEFAEASPDVLWTRTADTLAWVFLSPGFERIYGMPVAEALSGDTLKTWLELIVPGDRETALANIQKVAAGEKVTFEYRIARPDGEIRWLRDTDFPIRDKQGAVIRIGGVGHDVTEEKQAQARQAVLLAELHRRTRGMLADVRDLARQTAETAADLDDFMTHFDGRLAALGRAGVPPSGGLEMAAPLDGLILEEFLAAAGSDRLTVAGPDVILRGRTAEILSLAIHELVTNAVKFGALSTPDGHVMTSWTVSASTPGHLLVLQWRETGVAVIDPKPGRAGFGRRLLESVLPHELGAQTRLDFKPGGLQVRIEMPLGSEAS